MIPPPVAEEAHSPSLSCLPLTTALRISISGEGLELDSLADRGQCGQEEEQGARGGRSLCIPGDMPVDLRAKLAVAMINLEESVPEVLCVCGYMTVYPVCICDAHLTTLLLSVCTWSPLNLV